MSTLLLMGIAMVGLPALLILWFAGYIFFGFINDDKDARAIFNIAVLIMVIGLVFIGVHFGSQMIHIT